MLAASHQDKSSPATAKMGISDETPRTKRKLQAHASQASDTGSMASPAKKARKAPASSPKRLRRSVACGWYCARRGLTDIAGSERSRRRSSTKSTRGSLANGPTPFPRLPKTATSLIGTCRFYVLSRTRCGTAECPEETIEMVGTTGNIYHVHIAQQPTCDCPYAIKGFQCKHYLYVRLPCDARHGSG